MSDALVKLAFIQHLIHFHLTFTGMCEVPYNAVVFLYNQLYSQKASKWLISFCLKMGVNSNRTNC